MTGKECNVCKSLMTKYRLDGLLECKECSFVTADMNLSDRELRKIYTRDYFHGKEYLNYLSDKRIIQKNLKRRFYSILKLLNYDVKDKSLFELGCAYGFFLELAQGTFLNVKGVDISEDAVEHAKINLKVNAEAMDFLAMEEEKTYDVICMWDTIEHLRSPELYVKKISTITKPNGILALTTGDIGSFNARLRGKKWRQIHPPTHLHYFSEKSLKRLLESNGFSIEFVSHPGSYYSIDNIFYSILVLKYGWDKLCKLFTMSGITGILKTSIYLNLYDLVFIVGRKK